MTEQNDDNLEGFSVPTDWSYEEVLERLLNELRAPMTIIKGSAEILMNNQSGEFDETKWISKIHLVSQNVFDLLSSVRDYLEEKRAEDDT